MDHEFEQLGDRRFQQLVQALLLDEYPGLTCFPVGMPDGGRDGLADLSDDSTGPPDILIVQVKYAERPDYVSDPTRWVEDVLADEHEKIDRLIKRGAAKYLLVTNLPTSSHLDSGSHDKVQAVLDKLPIAAKCLWREDLNRRLEVAWDLKWAYPELMTGVDLIRVVLEGRISEAAEQRSRVLRTFLAEQFQADREVRFKQAELLTDLLDVFIDVPVDVPTQARGDRTEYVRLIGRLRWLAHSEPEDDMSAVRATCGAGSLLLDDWVQTHSNRLVIEGAPGQGKSTMLQYVTQVHRMRLLQKQEELARLPDAHRSAAVRIPFRVELRELAQWLSGVDPFSVEGRSSPERERTLEGFLAALVRTSSGGAPFDVADLQAVASVTPILLALDGLDEVVDIASRSAIVKELSNAINRLDAIAKSLQVIVTSRPASFAKSARFEEPFVYMRLGSLTRGLVLSYRDRWVSRRDLAATERRELTKILDDKLAQPHFRDLCRNPMQLAIILSLLHRKGPALPEQRTDLYTSYMEYFLDREATKSSAVRDHRKLLLLLHGYLACLLHIEAERSSRHAGRIRTEDLVATAEAFIESRGHSRNLFSDLFGRVFDRFGALVSRVEGTFEFEVQPLREYFAAFYLYETAPHSPPGRERQGTRPERLDAMLRHPFWLNVTRFYAGSYSVGELESLAGRLEALADDPQFRWTATPRMVAAQLLADWAMTQEPRAQERAVRILLRDVGRRHLLGGGEQAGAGYGERVIGLPAQCGGNRLVDVAFSVARSDMARRVGVLRLASALKANDTSEGLAVRWLKDMPAGKRADVERWWRLGRALDVFRRVDYAVLKDLIAGGEIGSRDEKLRAVVETGMLCPADEPSDDALSVIDLLLDKEVRLGRVDEPHPLRMLGRMLLTDRRVLARESRFFWGAFDDEWQLDGGDWSEVYRGCVEWAEVYDELVQHGFKWSQDLTPWVTLVEFGRKIFGDRNALDRLAICASAVRDPRRRGRGHSALLDDDISLVLRARYAQGRSMAVGWWRDVLEAAPAGRYKRLGLTLTMAWAAHPTLEALLPSIEAEVEALSKQGFMRLCRDLAMIADFGREGRRRMTLVEIDAKSPRVFTALEARCTDRWHRTVYTRRNFDIGAFGDATVLRTMMRRELEVAGDAKAGWTRTLEILRRMAEVGMGSYATRRLRAMPRDVAQEILARADEYPLFAVEAAEVGMSVTMATASVGAIAKRDGWLGELPGPKMAGQ